MNTKTCAACGMPEGHCFLMCPNNDPYAGDQLREDQDYEANAQFDYAREAFGDTAVDGAAEAMMDDEDDDFIPEPDVLEIPEHF